ncbi:MAG: hypothetical protein EA423_04085 [Phycisphaerales bacterium]|nr:MAG: hypothetical protein EA423_04085 [Phycisphaerales bacterium]
MANHPPRRAARRRIQILLAAAVALPMAACDRQTPGDSVRDASMKMLATRGGHAESAPDETRRLLQQDIRAPAQVGSGSMLEGEKAAAALLIAETFLGEAIIDARRLLGYEQLAQTGADHADQLVRASQRAGAQAQRTAFANDQLLQDLRRQSTGREQTLNQRRAELAELTAQRDQLNTRLREKVTLEGTERGRQAELDARASNASGEERERLAHETQRVRRVADRHAYDAELIQLDIDQIERQIKLATARVDAARSEVAATTTAIEHLEQVRQQANQAADEARRLAERAQAELAQALFGGASGHAGDLGRALREALSQRDETEMPARLDMLVKAAEAGLVSFVHETISAEREKALSAAEQAASRATAAARTLRSSSALAATQANEIAGAIHMRHALLNGRVAQVLESASALPMFQSGEAQSNVSQALERTRTARTEALQAARESFAEAAGRLEGVRAEDDRGNALLELAAKRLNDLAAYAEAVEAGRADQIDLETQLRDARRLLTQILTRDEVPQVGAREPRAGGQAQAGGAASPEREVLALVERALNMMQQDRFGDLPSLYRIEGSNERRLFDAMVSVAQNATRLENALQSRFGQGLEDTAFFAQAAAMDFEIPDFRTTTASDFSVSLMGDAEAMITGPAVLPGMMTDALMARRADGQWRLVFPPMEGPELSMVVNMQQALGRVMGQLAQRVERGEIDSFQRFDQAFATAMQQAMMGAMGGG